MLGMITVLCCPERGASQAQKSARFNWARIFLWWHTIVHIPPMFLSELCNFLQRLAFQEKIYDSSRLDVVEIACVA
jgi:hypothetical protein